MPKKLDTFSSKAEQKDKYLDERTHQWKLRFLSNISQELRTPLTLIIAQLDMLLRSAKITPYIHHRIISIQRNANKLMRLTNEMMDTVEQDEDVEKKRVQGHTLSQDKTVSHVGYTELNKQFVEEGRRAQRKYDKNKPYILIVENDTELRLMLVDIFSGLYRVQEASNGVEGLLKVRETRPDIVLSGLKMPLMSGIEMCVTLKSDVEISHIPVVLLTANTAIEQQLEGLKSGADDYIIKPFNSKILVARCNNMLYNRKIIQHKFTTEPVASIQTITNNPLDEQFIEKAIQFVKNNIDNEHLNVQMLHAELALSRTALFTKMRALIGQTPNEFIQSIRLKKAAWMIHHYPTKHITDIAMECGFSSVQYFGTTFKNHFGVLPTIYRKRKRR